MSAEHHPQFLLIDLFCGAGGTTTGAEMSGICKVIAAINHDPLAIASHASNHRDVLHITEDILVADISKLQECVAYWQSQFPKARLILWASLECTNFSDAKGGLPRDADSRALADGMPRYLKALNPDYFLIENVKEFMSWGPLKAKISKNENGNYCPILHTQKGIVPYLVPESRTAGKDYIRWIKSIQALGYLHDWRMLCAADFGGVTIRERYFGAFYKPGIPFAWPHATHAKQIKESRLFENKLKPWRPVSDVLDFSDFGKSIFDRKIPIVDKSIERVLSGLKKFKDEPMLVTNNTPGYCSPVSRPAGTITTVNSKSLVFAIPMLQSYYGNGQCRRVTEPAPTVTTRDRMAIVTPFMFSYYTRESSTRSLLMPSPTVACQDRIGIVSPVRWIDRQFGSGGHSSVNHPVGTLLTTPKTNLCTAFIVNPQYSNTGNSVHKPAPTVIATQKSRPLSLALATYAGSPKWNILPGDSAAMIKLKIFMRENGISDIYMRMLKVLELKRIQGFPDNYVLLGSDEKKKKFIGNSVETGVVCSWIRAIGKAE